MEKSLFCRGTILIYLVIYLMSILSIIKWLLKIQTCLQPLVFITVSDQYYQQADKWASCKDKEYS